MPFLLLALLNDIMGSPFWLVARSSRFRRLGSGGDLETLLFKFLTKDPFVSGGGAEENFSGLAESEWMSRIRI